MKQYRELPSLLIVRLFMHYTGNVPIVEDNAKLKQEVSALKAQVTQLKEDNGRKSKLQNDLKQAKVADEHALSQWKQEVAVQEDNCKRSVGRSVEAPYFICRCLLLIYLWLDR